MPQRFEKLFSDLQQNIASVKGLVSFDKLILDICIKNLNQVDQKLAKSYHDNNPMRLKSTIQMFENIRKNQSTKINYKTIYNQSLVLLVSYFSRAVEDLFEMHIEDCIISKPIDSKKSGKLDEITICINDLVNSNFSLQGRLGQLIIDKNNYNFQNMGSIKRAFSDFYEFESEKDEIVNNLIIATELRHCIVHSGTILDDKNYQKIQRAGANPRTLKNDLKCNQDIEFVPQEIELTADCMVTYIQRLYETGIKPYVIGKNKKSAQ